MSLRWHKHFLEMSLHCSQMSKDPSTRVGAVIVGPDREVLSTGYNGFPRGVRDTPERLGDRATKYGLVVHAEMNALLTGARHGVRMNGCTLYVTAQDVKTGAAWGGPPCLRCAVELIQGGIRDVVAYPLDTAPDRWRSDQAYALKILQEAGVSYREISI